MHLRSAKEIYSWNCRKKNSLNIIQELILVMRCSLEILLMIVSAVNCRSTWRKWNQSHTFITVQTRVRIYVIVFQLSDKNLWEMTRIHPSFIRQRSVLLKISQVSKEMKSKVCGIGTFGTRSMDSWTLTLMFINKIKFFLLQYLCCKFIFKRSIPGVRFRMWSQ